MPTNFVQAHLRLIAIVVAVILVTGCLIGLVLSLPAPTSNQNGNNSSSSTSTTATAVTSTATSTMPALADYSFAAISAADTVVLLNPTTAPVTINLDHRVWLMPKWSPDGKLLSVLGRQDGKKAIYDLYIFDPANNSWRRATDYKNTTTGVLDYEWNSNNSVAFIQGNIPNRWLHTYDYANQEIRKIFQTDKEIAQVDIPGQKYILETASIYQITDFSGTQIAVSGSQEFRELAIGRQPGEYVVLAGFAQTDIATAPGVLWYPASGEKKKLVYEVGEPAPGDTPMRAHCPAANNALLVTELQIASDSLGFGFFTPEQNEYKVPTGTDHIIGGNGNNVRLSKKQCRGDRALLLIEEYVSAKQSNFYWYVATDTLTKLTLPENYKYLAMK